MALKFTILFLNLAKIQIFIPKSAYGGGGPPVQELFLKKTGFSASLTTTPAEIVLLVEIYLVYHVDSRGVSVKNENWQDEDFNRAGLY